ncbi:MAG TPA: MFS transporter [Dongiaceae bacterium]
MSSPFPVDATPGTPASVLRLPAFRFFWSARVLSTMAFQLQGVAVGWQMYALTHSTLALGFVGLVQFLPMLCLTLVVGHVADRYDRRRIAAICQLVGGSATTLLAIGSFGGWMSPPLIFTAVAVIGAGRAFEMPSLQALLPGLVPASLFPRAIAYSAAAIQTATIIGPAIGGFIYVAGPEAPYAIAALFSLSAALLTSCIRMVRTPPRREPVNLITIFSGFAFIRSHPIVLGSISLDLFAVLLGGATALLPVYARDILHTGPWGLGLLRSGPAVGALAMSIWLAHHPLRRHVGLTMFRAVMLFGLATILFALSGWLWLSTLAMVVLGASDVISVVVRSSFVQLSTPDHMRGRVTAVNSLFIGTSNQLGEFESGVTATLFGTVPAVVLGGVGTILVALLWMRLFPALRHADTLESVAREAEAPP